MPDGSGDYYPDGAQITNLASIDEAVVTLYAQWEPISYTVSFDSNGGDGTMSDMVMTYDTEYVLNANSFQKEGFEFNGWSTSENGKVEYEDGETVKNLLSVDGEITLYASWSKVTANPDGTETSVTTETDTVGSQTITTTVTTVINSETGEVINTTTEISTSSGNITTTATVSGSEAIVTVNAESSASLDDVVGQAELISKVIKEDPELPDDVSEMEIVFENEGVGASVTLTLDVVSSLKEQARTASVLIVVDDFESQSMTPEQIMALGNGTAFELSAVVVDEDNNIISTLHELGGYVDAFLPYSGDVSGLGVFYIDEQGNTTHMESRYDSTREGFVFKTNHFSMFAVMAIPEVIPDEPNIPPYYPDDDYPYIPPTIVVNDDGSDDNLTIIACAAAAVVAALMAVFLIVEYRKK